MPEAVVDEQTGEQCPRVVQEGVYIGRESDVGPHPLVEIKREVPECAYDFYG